MVGTAHSMMKAKQLPGIFWGEVASAMVYTLHRTITKVNQDRTLYELLVGSTPTVHHLRMFRCVSHIKMTGNLKKLDDCSKPVIFVGYKPGSKAYLTYDLVLRQICISRDIMFDEKAKWSWDGAQSDNEFVIDYV
jgi:hypothetical protein